MYLFGREAKVPRHAKRTSTRHEAEASVRLVVGRDFLTAIDPADNEKREG